MGQGAPHGPGLCGCLPTATGEFDVATSGFDASSSSALPTFMQRTGQLRRLPLTGPGEEALPAHRRMRGKGPATHKLLSNAIASNVLFGSLDALGLEELVASLDYYSFDKNEFIVKEGEVGSHIFISATPGLEVLLGGGSVAELPRGRTFGELAMLTKCPRSVSVVAASPNVGVWGMQAKTFKEVAQNAMLARLNDNRAFIDTIPFFEGLTVRQRDAVCDVATLQTIEAKGSLQLKDLDVQQMFLVKVGELCVFDPSRNDRAYEVQVLRPGDIVGERTLLFGEPFDLDVQAVTRSELLALDLKSLRKVLGDALDPICIQRPLILANLQRANALSSLDASQREVVVRNMEYLELAPDQELAEAPPLCVILDGSSQIGSGVSAIVLDQGQCFGDLPLAQPPARPQPLVAAPSGCRLAILTKRGVSVSLEELGVDPASLGWEDEEHKCERMLLEISKVCVFRHLPLDMRVSLVKSVTRHIYSEGDVVFKQGDEGSSFCIVVLGAVQAKVDGEVVRSLGKNAYFGERALMLDEARAASIHVVSSKAEIWAIDKDTFRKVVQKNVQLAQQLQHRMWLQDHGIALGDLKCVSELGCGSSGTVQLVQHRETNFMYALKKVPKPNREAMAVARREIEVLAENDHPFIMHLVKTFETPKSFYMLTEYCAGGELHEAIRTITTVLSKKQSMFYIGSLLLMLEALHERHVVYRDLKPENIMLDSQGYLKLIDFGTAKKLDRNCPRTYTMVGTPHYMAPEVIRGKGYGIESDVWAMGIILYELMCGYLPFADEVDPHNSDIVIQTVLAGDLQFPPRDVLDEHGRNLMEKILMPFPASRLGCDAASWNGYQEIKSHPFFGMDAFAGGQALNGESKGNEVYFGLLLSRELQAPLPATIKPISERPDLPSDVPAFPPSPTSPKSAKSFKNLTVDVSRSRRHGDKALWSSSRELVESPQITPRLVPELKVPPKLNTKVAENVDGPVAGERSR